MIKIIYKIKNTVDTIKISELGGLLKEGDTFFNITRFKWYKPSTYISVLISKVCHAPSHTGSVYKDSTGGWTSIGAVLPGVSRRSISEEFVGKVVTIRRRVGQDMVWKKKYVESQLGVPYDYSSTLFFQLVFQLTGEWLGLRGKFARREWYCYELEAFASGFNQDPVDPMDFYYWDSQVTVLHETLVIEG